MTTYHLRRAAAVLALLLFLALLAQSFASAQPTTGTLRGDIEVVGATPVRDGEVVVARIGSDEAVATGNFSASSLSYAVVLPSGGYTAYATAPVYRASPRVALNITAGGTTWLNLTIVRVEEVLGQVNSTKGGPVNGAVVQFRENGTVEATGTTDPSGAFRITIDPGNYTVLVTKAGFKDVQTGLLVGPGQVVALPLAIEPTGGAAGGGGTPVMALAVIAFVMLAMFGSFYYVGLQARRIRAAAVDAEARRARGSVCPECGSDVPAAASKCPKCGFTFQVRCSDCGRLVDLKEGTAGECPECGAMLK